MGNARFSVDAKLVYCICPHCKTPRKKVNNSFTIVKRGYERNGLARFLCFHCNSWFNEQSGDILRWLER